MSSNVFNSDNLDIQEVTQSITELATNASALAVNAIAVAKSASQLRLNERLISKMTQDSKRSLNEVDITQRSNRNPSIQQELNEEDYSNGNASGFSSRATTLAPANINVNMSSVSMPHQGSENFLPAPLPAATSSAVDSTLTSVSAMRNQGIQQLPFHGPNQTTISGSSKRSQSIQPPLSANIYSISNQTSRNSQLLEAPAKTNTLRSRSIQSTQLTPQISSAALPQVLTYESNNRSRNNNSAALNSHSSFGNKSHMNMSGTAKSRTQSLANQRTASNLYNHSRTHSSRHDLEPLQYSNTVKSIVKDIIELKNRSEVVPSQATRHHSSSHKNFSEIEEAILRSVNPIEFNETEEIVVNGQRGIWANKSEIENWRGIVPINHYPINQDENPEVITKKSQQHLEYVQELAIRYLKPPTPPAPGEIIINQEPNQLTPPAPPIIIRQQPARPDTPEPLVVREAPPPAPEQIGRKVITISGKRLPPPPRKVVIERLAPLPSKPQSVIIERWLPYSEVKRRVIFNRNTQPDPVVITPKNIIVQWSPPKVEIKKEFKYLGVIRANPFEYVQRYSESLKDSSNLPDFVTEIPNPAGIVLAAEHTAKSVPELEGDIEALKLINLDNEGLSEYKDYLNALNHQSNGSSYGSLLLHQEKTYSSSGQQFADNYSGNIDQSIENLIERIFNSIDRNASGRISIADASAILLRLNSRLRRSYGEDDVKALFKTLDSNKDGKLDINEFKRAFFNLDV